MPRRLEVEVIADVDRYRRGLRGASNETEIFGRSLKGMAKTAGLAAGAAALGGLVLGMRSSVKAASNLGESVNAVNVVFGKAAKQVLNFSENAAKKAGLSMRAFNELVTPVGAGLINVGFSADKAASASVALARRAADMASVFNTDVSDALEAIQAGLRGEADPLERFGVGLSDAAVKAKVMAMELAENEKAITAQDKATARLKLIMEQTNRVAGDFTNTSGSMANQQRILSARFEDLQAKIGQKLLPVVTMLLAELLKFTNWAEREWPKAEKALKNGADTIANAWEKVAPFVEAVGKELRALAQLVVAISEGDWSKAWSKLKDVVTNALNLAKQAIILWGKTIGKLLANIVIGAMNLAIRAINRGIKAVNDALPDSIGIGPAKINLPDNPLPSFPEIPQLAQGGIVTKPTLAMLGEGGHNEAVVPLSGPNAPRGLGATFNFHFPNYIGDKRELERAMRDAAATYFRRNAQPIGAF